MQWVPAAHGAGVLKDFVKGRRLTKATRIGFQELWRIAVLFERKRSFWRDVAAGGKGRERQANRADPLRRQDQPAMARIADKCKLDIGATERKCGPEVVSISVFLSVLFLTSVALAAASPSGRGGFFSGDDGERALCRAV